MKKKKFIFILLLIVIISVGFSAISATLSITGNSTIARNTWNVHFENVQVTSGSVTASTPVISNNDTQVTYNVTLNMPGDYYEFTVDAVNEGTIDAMIQTFSNTGLTTEQEKYLSYSIKYANGVDVANKHLLAHGSSATYRVRVSYRDDLEATDLPDSDQTISLTFSVTYEQADSSAIAIYNFATDSWSTIINNVRNNNTSFYHVGDTKTITMNEYGETTVRISNMSTPAACSNTGFSQTACGFVLEFDKKVTTHMFYDSDYNTGGWPATDMRAYANADFYNNMPADLRAGIIDTYVVSGHGSGVVNNFTTTDKIYLLSATEIYGASGSTADSAASLTRQLDYYADNNITTTNYSLVNKNSWPYHLRNCVSNSSTDFNFVGPYGNLMMGYARHLYALDPAFRIG